MTKTSTKNVTNEEEVATEVATEVACEISTNEEGKVFNNGDEIVSPN